MTTELQVFNYASREAWLADRNSGIGASESAALFGLSRWESPLSLWAQKTGMVEPEELEGEHLEWGLILEQPIAARYVQQTGRKIWQAGPWAVARHPEYPFIRATPDRFVIESPDHDGRGVLEIKNTSVYMGDDWSEGPPPHVQAQVQHQLAVTGFRWGSVAVLVGGNQFKYFDLERDDDFIGELIEQCKAFWKRVETKDAPAADGTAATSRILKRLHPLDTGAEIAIDADTIVNAWIAAKEQEKAAKEAKDAAQNRLAQLIGSASIAKLPSGRAVSFKHQSRDGYTVEKTTFRVLREIKPKKGAK